MRASLVGCLMPHPVFVGAGAFDPTKVRTPVTYWAFSNANRKGTFTDPGGAPGQFGNDNIRSLNGRTDKRYFEFVWSVTDGGDIGDQVLIGACASSFSVVVKVGFATTCVGYDNSGRVFLDGSVVTTIATYVVGDVVMMAVDPSNGHTWFGVNGVWTGDPAAGTGFSVTAPIGTLHAVVGGDNVNSGGTPVVLYEGTGGFTAATQTYAAPAGFTAWDA